MSVQLTLLCGALFLVQANTNQNPTVFHVDVYGVSDVTVKYYMDTAADFFIGSYDFEEAEFDAVKAANDIGGSFTCPCINNTSLVTAGIDDGYGLDCKQHDKDSSECTHTNSCLKDWCYVDGPTCQVKNLPSHTNPGLYFSYGTCGYAEKYAGSLSLEGQTLRVMFAPEPVGTAIGWWSNHCTTAHDQFPVGCEGFAISILGRMQALADFTVQATQILPDSFWTGILQLCDDDPTTGVCGGSVWTVCAYAAGMGYVDFCPASHSASNERTGQTTGLLAESLDLTLWTMSAAQPSVMEEAFKIFSVWAAPLWIMTLCFTGIGAITIRYLCGFYTGFEASGSNLFNEFMDLVWFGGGLFLDLVYPQHLPDHSAKMVLLVFEFVQVILLASITASLSAMLVLEDTRGIQNIDEAINAKLKVCFLYPVILDMFMDGNPTFPADELAYTYDGMASLDTYAEGGCGGVVEFSIDGRVAQSKGEFCQYEERELVYKMAMFYPTSKKYHHALEALQTTIQSNGVWLQEWNKNLKLAMMDTPCDSTSEKDHVGLGLGFFAGIFIMFAVVAVLSVVLRCLGVTRVMTKNKEALTNLGTFVGNQELEDYRYSVHPDLDESN